MHGTVKAGNIPLPGVSVVATNTLTGQRYATVTDINGSYSMNIPANGRYVLKTELAAFGPETKVVLIKSASGPTSVPPVNQQADFAFTLASRVPPESPQENVAGAPAPGPRPAATVRRNAAGGAQNLALLAQLAGAEETGISTGAAGASAAFARPTTVTSQRIGRRQRTGGDHQPFAGIDMEQIRQNAELDQ